MGSIGGPEFLIILVILLVFAVVPVWGIVDAALIPDAQWRAAEQNKIVWIIVQVFLGIIGALIYFLVIRPRVKKPTAV